MTGKCHDSRRWTANLVVKVRDMLFVELPKYLCSIGLCRLFSADFVAGLSLLLNVQEITVKLRDFGNCQSSVQRTGNHKQLKDFRSVPTVRLIVRVFPFLDHRQTPRRCGILAKLSVNGPGFGFPFQDLEKKKDAAA